MPTYKSNLERDFYNRFKLAYETHRIPYVVTHQYTPDFTISDTAFVECKGRFIASDRQKHIHIKKQHPHLKILFVFQDFKRKLSKTSKTTYADWCNKHGFEFCAANDYKTIMEYINRYK